MRSFLMRRHGQVEADLLMDGLPLQPALLWQQRSESCGLAVRKPEVTDSQGQCQGGVAAVAQKAVLSQAVVMV